MHDQYFRYSEQVRSLIKRDIPKNKHRFLYQSHIQSFRQTIYLITQNTEKNQTKNGHFYSFFSFRTTLQTNPLLSFIVSPLYITTLTKDATASFFTLIEFQALAMFSTTFPKNISFIVFPPKLL